MDLSLQRIEPERCHEDILIGMLGNSKGVAEGLPVRERILRTDLHLAEIAFIDTIPYTARNLPNLR